MVKAMNRQTSAAPAFDIPFELNSALNAKRFALVAQPIYGQGVGAPVGHELLSRLVDSTGTLIPAGQFLQAAAQKNVMPVLDAHTLQLLRDRILPYMPPGSQWWFALNVSAMSLLNNEYLEKLFSPTWTHMAKKLVLEVPVTDFTQHKTIIPVLKRLRQVGYRVGVDYFGNREMIKAARNLQIDNLKFDFCRPDFATITQEMLNELIGEANDNGFTTIAARVENPEQHAMARKAGFTYYQGNHYGEAIWPCSSRRMDLEL